VKKRNNIELICNVGELTSLFRDKTQVEDFLQHVVELVVKHMQADACSVYLLDHATGELVLRATVGLSKDFIGKLKLSSGEGITGTALESFDPIRVPRASEDPHFKYIPGIHEEEYEAFLAVPIINGFQKIGVLVVQHRKPDYFIKEDARALTAIASQLAAVLENARLLLEMRGGELKPEEGVKTAVASSSDFLPGIAASGGIAMGNAEVLGSSKTEFLYAEDKDHYNNDIQSFFIAMDRSADQLRVLQQQMEQQLFDVSSLIFSSHLLMLQDSSFYGEMIEKIKNGETPVDAVVEVVNSFIHLLSKSEHQNTAEKILDVKDVGHRILRNMLKESVTEGDYTGQIVIAEELLPSELFKLTTQHVEGFIFNNAGITAHIAVLSRSLKVPVVILEDKYLHSPQEGDFLILDGYQGNVFVNPENAIIDQYREVKLSHQEIEKKEQYLPDVIRTADGVDVSLMANVNILSDVKTASTLNAQGIGLYRSEFPFIIRKNFPSEEEQYRVYSRLLNEMQDKEVLLRTLDIGADKMVGMEGDSVDNNPLGLRAIRFSLKNLAIFKTQLRAMLRAGKGEKEGIMFPLVSSIDEFKEAKAIVKECMRDLEEEKIPFNQDIKIGMMVELPSAVELCKELSREADFISIGTNDLIQYLLGVDRTNVQVADFYISYHPAVFRVLKRIVHSAQRWNCDISVCGDTATDPVMLTFFLGIGLRKFSVEPRMLVKVWERIGKTTISDAEAFAKKILKLPTIKKIRHFLKDFSFE